MSPRKAKNRKGSQDELAGSKFRQPPTVVRSGKMTSEELAEIQQTYPERPTIVQEELRTVAPRATGDNPLPFGKLKDVLERIRQTGPKDEFADSEIQRSTAPALTLAPAPGLPQRVSLGVPLPLVTQDKFAGGKFRQPSTELRIPWRKPVFKHAICIITKNMNGLHVIIGKPKKVSCIKPLFRIKDHSFLVDISKAFMVGNKGVYIMYDLDVAEPLERTVVNRKGAATVTHAPLEFGDEVHYSQPLDMTMTQKVFEQAFRALGEGPGAFSWMTLVMLAVGALLGYFAGNTMPMNKSVTVVTTTTTAAKMLLGWI